MSSHQLTSISDELSLMDLIERNSNRMDALLDLLEIVATCVEKEDISESSLLSLSYLMRDLVSESRKAFESLFSIAKERGDA